MKKIDGMLLYVQLQKAVRAYVKPGEEAKPDEWKASVAVIDEDVIDEYEAFAKQKDAKVSIKKVKTAEFESIYKVAPPEGAGKNVWIVTLRKSTMLGKSGKPVPEQYRPRVFEKMGQSIVDVTASKLPANGSIGSISIDVFTRENGTSSFYLKNVLVTKLIEYVAPEGSAYNPGDEFGDDPDTGAEDAPTAKQEVSKDIPF